MTTEAAKATSGEHGTVALSPQADTSGDIVRTSDIGIPQSAAKLTVIEPRRGWIPIDWKELSEFRELLYFLTWRDIKVRYKQTVLGAAWAILQPLMTMVVFTIFFGKLAKIPSDGIPYPVFAYAGLLPWTFFANSVSQAGQSLVNQQHLLTKVYFPRLFVPMAPVGAAFVDLMLASGVLGVIMAFYGVAPTTLIVIAPLLVLLTAVAALGIGLLLAALTVTYRDFRYVIPFMIQLWLFCTPVVYPVSMVPERWQWLLALNPMGGIVTAFRAALVGTPMNWNHLAISAAVAAGLLVLGAAYFRRVERRFADIA